MKSWKIKDTQARLLVEPVYQSPAEYPDVAEAHDNWAARDKELRELRASIENYALGTGAAQAEANDRFNREVEAALAGQELEPVPARPARGELIHRCAVLQAVVARLRETYDAAVARRSVEILKATQPAHREAVRRMAKAYIALSVAVAAEAQMHRDLSTRQVRRNETLIPPMAVHNVGEWPASGSAVQLWLEFGRKRGFFDDADIASWSEEAGR